MADLLNKAATYLDEEYSSPFCDAFLQANDVTFDECMSLADLMAAGSRLVAWGLNNPAAARAAMEGADLGMRHKTFMDIMDKLGAAGR